MGCATALASFAEINGCLTEEFIEQSQLIESAVFVDACFCTTAVIACEVKANSKRPNVIMETIRELAP